jgi:hypothetical protein
MVSYPNGYRAPYSSSLFLDPANGLVYVGTRASTATDVAEIEVFQGTALLAKFNFTEGCDCTPDKFLYDPVNGLVYISSTDSGIWVMDGDRLVGELPLHPQYDLITVVAWVTDNKTGLFYASGSPCYGGLQSCDKGAVMVIAQGTKVLKEIDYPSGRVIAYGQLVYDPLDGLVYGSSGMATASGGPSGGYYVTMPTAFSGTQEAANLTSAITEMAYDPLNGYLYGNDPVQNSVDVIVGTSSHILNFTASASSSRSAPLKFLFDQKNGLVYSVTQPIGELPHSSVWIINGMSLVRTIPISGSGEVSGSAWFCDPSSGYVYLSWNVGNLGGGQRHYLVIDGSTVLRNSTRQFIEGFSYNPSDGLVYGYSLPGQIVVIDHGGIVGNLSLMANPYGLGNFAYDAANGATFMAENDVNTLPWDHNTRLYEIQGTTLAQLTLSNQSLQASISWYKGQPYDFIGGEMLCSNVGTVYAVLEVDLAPALYFYLTVLNTQSSSSSTTPSTSPPASTLSEQTTGSSQTNSSTAEVGIFGFPYQLAGSVVLVETLALSLLLCVPLAVVEIRKGTALRKGRGGRTLGWFLLPVIFLPGAYGVYGSLASGTGSILTGPSPLSGLGTSTGVSQLVTQMLSVSSVLWIAWIPILVYSGVARDSVTNKISWILKRLAAALVLSVVFTVLAATLWYSSGISSSSASTRDWVTAASDIFFLLSVSPLLAVLCLFTGFVGGTLLPLPVLVTSFALAALVRRAPQMKQPDIIAPVERETESTPAPKYCPSCGSAVAAEATFCDQCGNKL